MFDVRPRVETAMFPDERPASANRWVVAIAYAVAALAGCIVLYYWGTGGMRPTTRIWAEDGTVFLTSAHVGTMGGTIFTPYAGYLHVVPRLIALSSTAFPLADAARLFAVASIVVRVAVALFVFRASNGVLRSVAARAGLAASVVVLPVAGLETLNNIANLHWFLTFAAFFALLWKPTRWWDCLLAALVVLLAITSDPTVAIYFPLVVLRGFALPRWRDQLVTTAFVVGGIIQLVAVLQADRGPHETFSAGHIARFFGYRIVVGTLGGFRRTHWLQLNWGGFAIAVGSVVMLALLLPAVLRKSPRRWFAVTCVIFATVIFVVALRDPRIAPGMAVDVVTSVPRYDLVPSLLALSAIAAGLDAIRVRRASRLNWWSMLLRLAVASVVLSALPPDLTASDKYWNRAVWADVQPWPNAVASAAGQCETIGGGDIRIAILPVGWYVELPCSVVVADRKN